MSFVSFKNIQLFIIALIIAAIVHCLLLFLFSFRFSLKKESFKPQMIFLGGIYHQFESHSYHKNFDALNLNTKTITINTKEDMETFQNLNKPSYPQSGDAEKTTVKNSFLIQSTEPPKLKSKDPSIPKAPTYRPLKMTEL